MISTIEDFRDDLKKKIHRWTENGDLISDAIPGLSLIRHTHVHEPVCGMHEPSLCLIVQGGKRMVIGGETYDYDAEHYLLTAINLPTLVQITSASPDHPYLGLVFKLDLPEISRMLVESKLPAAHEDKPIRGMATGPLTLPILAPIYRLVSLLDTPEDIPVLGPMVRREIYYRLLTGALGRHLRQVASAGSKTENIAKVVSWLRDNFKAPFRVEDLALKARMSNSSFYSQFRSMTALSPLQYQKNLRLNEARRLMIAENFDAAAAAFEVGYENPSQFSREYKRTYGIPPKQDVMKIREMIQTGAAAASPLIFAGPVGNDLAGLLF